MPKLALKFRRRAEKDLDGTLTFGVARFGRDVGLNYARGLSAACELLRDFPEMAPVAEQVRRPTRVLHHRSHRVFYRIEPDRVLILRILHHARDTPPAL